MSPDPGSCDLTEAGPELVAKVYRASHTLWGAGLSRSDYAEMWQELARLPWARERFRVLVWTDDGRRVVSSLKLYRPRVRIGGIRGDACGIGAVFTPREHRGRGHARAMLRRVLEGAARSGDLISLLFSDIEPALYESLGFRGLKAEEATGGIPDREDSDPGAIRLRPLGEDDLPAVKEAHDQTIASNPFAVERDLEHWRFLVARSDGYFRRLGGASGGRRFQVAERDGRFAGYLVSVDSDRIWELREVGARGGDPELLAAVARAGAMEARHQGLGAIQGWLSREWRTRVPEWRLRFQRRTHAIPMVRPVGMNTESLGKHVSASTFLPYLDQF